MLSNQMEGEFVKKFKGEKNIRKKKKIILLIV